MAEIISFTRRTTHRNKDGGNPAKIIPIELATTIRKKQIRMEHVKPEEPIRTEFELVSEEISVLEKLIEAIKGGLRGKEDSFSNFFRVNNDIERKALETNLLEQNRLLRKAEMKLKTLKKD